MPARKPSDLRVLDVADIGRHMPALIGLIIDVVEGGASVGFLQPISDAAARRYWTDVRVAVEAGTRILVGAFVEHSLVGAVQLNLAQMPNSAHRAEVMKLLVHRDARGRGLARALMVTLEEAARAAHRTLLVLDTRDGDAAEKLYATLGYVKAGTIPGWAKSANGTLHDTVVMYKTLTDADNSKL